MKTLFNLMLLPMLLFCFASCNNEDAEEELSLEINYANLEGTWKLTEWNGQPVVDGTYCYISLVRKDRTYKIYQKFDSMYARLITGEYFIEQDDYLGYIISGTYDYGMGDWNNSYIVTDLLQSGSMIWTVKGDNTDVSKYERCEKVPDEIIKEAEVQ